MNEQQIRLHSVGTKIIRFEATTGKSFSLKKQNKTKNSKIIHRVQHQGVILLFPSNL